MWGCKQSKQASIRRLKGAWSLTQTAGMGQRERVGRACSVFPCKARSWEPGPRFMKSPRRRHPGSKADSSLFQHLESEPLPARLRDAGIQEDPGPGEGRRGLRNGASSQQNLLPLASPPLSSSSGISVGCGRGVVLTQGTRHSGRRPPRSPSQGLKTQGGSKENGERRQMPTDAQGYPRHPRRRWGSASRRKG